MRCENFTSGRSAVLFDVDGTLANSIPMILAGLGDAFERFTGVRPSESEVAALIGRALRDQMNLFGLGESDPEGLAERIRYTMERFDAHKDLCNLFEPAVAAWERCMDMGYRTALVTSKNTVELAAFLEDFPRLKKAEALVCSSDVERPKPAPDSALLACERLGVRPDQAIMVGDSVHDLECARAAGLPCVCVSYGAMSRADLARHAPEALLDRPEDLLDWVNQNLTPLICHAKR